MTNCTLANNLSDGFINCSLHGEEKKEKEKKEQPPQKNHLMDTMALHAWHHLDPFSCFMDKTTVPLSQCYLNFGLH